jgi:hypothetical protein
MPDAIAELNRILGGSSPDLTRLDPGEASLLLALVVAARRDQDAALSAAIDSTLQALPRLVRMPARKILFG